MRYLYLYIYKNNYLLLRNETYQLIYSNSSLDLSAFKFLLTHLRFNFNGIYLLWTCHFVGCSCMVQIDSFSLSVFLMNVITTCDKLKRLAK